MTASADRSSAPAARRLFDASSTASEVVAGIDLTGRRAIVTGGASGIGYETARALASAGAAVTLAVRDAAAGQDATARLNQDQPVAPVRAEPLDLADLASIRAFAARWGDAPLSILVNNAGVMACPFGTTLDGFELQFGTNHLGHFLLTRLLVHALKAGAPSRMVSLSSSAHMASGVDLEDPHYASREYSPFAAYGQSKSANALFALEFDRRYRDSGIRAFSVMPGVIDATRLGRHIDSETMQSLREKGPPIDHLLKDLEQGAATSVWAATAPEAESLGGQYLENCAAAPLHRSGLPRGIGVMEHAADPLVAEQLWALSERLVS